MNNMKVCLKELVGQNYQQFHQASDDTETETYQQLITIKKVTNSPTPI